MPPESRLSDEDIRTFDEVRRFFVANPDPACVPLFLASFADDMGTGVYQLCDDVFAAYSQSTLTPHLADAMRSPHKGVRWWAAHWAVQFSALELFEPQKALVGRPDEADAHRFALSAICVILEATKDTSVAAFLRDRAATESDPELRDVILDCLRANTAV